MVYLLFEKALIILMIWIPPHIVFSASMGFERNIDVCDTDDYNRDGSVDYDDVSNYLKDSINNQK